MTTNNNEIWWECKCGWIGTPESTAIMHFSVEYNGHELQSGSVHICPMCKKAEMRNTTNPFERTIFNEKLILEAKK